MKTEVSIKDLIEAGVHFGHQKRRWNPKMRQYIFEERNGLYIIDLAKTLKQLRDAVEVARSVVANKQSILFVGTKKQAKSVIKECAEECNEFYVCERWLGGMLTNLTTIRQSIKKLERIERQIAAGAEGLKKKEVSELNRTQMKLDRNLSGIRTMKKPPGLVVVIDPGYEHIAVAEANKLGIPVMALVDTNCDPDPVQHVIAGNDDALKSVKLVVQAISFAITEQKSQMRTVASKDDGQVAEEEKYLEAPKEEMEVAALAAESSEKENSESSQ